MQRTTILDDSVVQPGLDGGERVEMIGRFAVTDRLGAGGMGQVFEAHDRELDRRVAVKVLHEHAVRSPTAKTRLLREAQAIAKLSHPNVVSVYDVGRHGEQVYIAMELIEGHTLGAWLLQAPRSWAEVVQIFIAVAEGLQAMHEIGIVHRDLKPANILVDRRGRPRIIDFGLARALDRPTETDDVEPSDGGLLDLQLTRTGALAGTPRYMSPEQFRRDPPSPASDQFSFCIALFEALYQQSPFVGDTVSARGSSVLSGEPLDPGPSDVPSELLDVLRRGLRTDADARWLSMGELVGILRKLVAAHDPDLDNPDEARRRRSTVAAVVVLIIVGPGAANLAFLFGWLRYDGLTHLVVTLISALAFIVIALGLRPMWQGSKFGRRLTIYASAVVATFTTQSVTGFLVDQPPHEAALANLVSFTVLTFFASAFVHPVLRIPGVVGVFGVLVGIAVPHDAVTVHNVTMGFATAALLVVVPRRKSLHWVSRAASSTGATGATGGQLSMSASQP